MFSAPAEDVPPAGSDGGTQHVFYSDATVSNPDFPDERDRPVRGATSPVVRDEAHLSSAAHATQMPHWFGAYSGERPNFVVISAGTPYSTALPAHPAPAGRNRWMLPLCLAAAAICVVQVGVLLSANTTLREMRSLTGKLERIDEFEKRVGARLDSFNVGVQTLIGETNNRVGFINGELRAAVTASQQASEQLTGLAAGFEEQVNALREQPAPVVEAEPDSGKNVRRSVRRSANGPVVTASQMPAASKAFRRTVAEDGTVRYEKIR